jgi:hypothetical protein
MASWFAYRTTIDADDWDQARRAIAALDPGTPLLVAPDWLEPRARMEIPAAAVLSSVARPDLRGIPRFAVLGHGDATWSDALQADLEGLDPPEMIEQRSLGSLSLTTYQLHGARSVLADFSRAATLQVATGSGACRGGPDRFTCPDGLVATKPVEIEYRPRQCISVDVADGTRATIIHPQMPTGDVLVGHAGFYDYNGRLRSDAPVAIAISIDAQVVARFVVTDSEGWRPWSIPTPTGVHDVAVEVQVALRGTWARTGYQPSEPRPVCFELRSLEAAP